MVYGARISIAEDAEDGDLSAAGRRRVAWRLSLGFLLDIISIGRPYGDVLDVLLIAAVVNANFAPMLRDPDLHARYARISTPLPDAERRPISVNALAASVDQPFETVRRRVSSLVARGICAVTSAGVYVPGAAVTAQRHQFGAVRRYSRFWRFQDELVRVHLFDPPSFTPLAADDPAAPVSGVGRIVTDYWLRCLEDLRRAIRDPVTGVIYLGLLRANCEHLLTVAAVERVHAGQPAGEEGRPVRLADLARRLGMAYETTRRHVAWLIDHGYCVREPAGLVFAPEALNSPELAALVANNLINVRRMFRQAIALTAAPSQQPPAAAGDGA